MSNQYSTVHSIRTGPSILNGTRSPAELVEKAIARTINEAPVAVERRVKASEMPVTPSRTRPNVMERGSSAPSSAQSSGVAGFPKGAFVGGASVSIKRLSKDFGPVRVLDDISLSIKAGEFLTLLGPSGSGKTTTLMALAGFVEPSAGEIEIDGREVSRLPATAGT